MEKTADATRSNRRKSRGRPLLNCVTIKTQLSKAEGVVNPIMNAVSPESQRLQMRIAMLCECEEEIGPGVKRA
eukprot:scaffold28089_cov135-Isochrysis_galbana.AAC.1